MLFGVKFYSGDNSIGYFMSAFLLGLTQPSLPPFVAAQINMDLFIVPGLSDCCSCVLHSF